ncbi:synaptotagmin-like protein 3 isoform X1 [Arapaima gigas]
MDLNHLKALEREKVLEVLQRDKVLRSVEEERIRKMKLELQEIRRKGAKSFSRQYSQRTCARCQRPLGKFWNCGAICRSCSHCICNKCRISITTQEWKCTVCHAYRQALLPVKIKSGEWFLEERAKKFPAEGEKNETTGEKLLKSYQSLSTIYIVPPTPPPFFESQSFGNPMGLENSRPFTKSVENIFTSLTTHIKKISKSQNDMSMDATLLTADYCKMPVKDRRSMSDTAISRTPNLSKAPSLPNLFKKKKDDDNEEETQNGMRASDEDTSSSTWHSGEKTMSLNSLYTEYGFFTNAAVSGEIKFAVNYNFQSSSLEITVSQCRNLKHGEPKRNKCHPYVKIYLLPEKSPSRKLKTSIKKNTVNPVFNETFSYQIEHPQLNSRTLQVSVWHCGTLQKKVFLGEVLIPLQGWKFGDSTTQCSTWYQLCPKSTCSEGTTVEQQEGEMLVKVNFTFPSQQCRFQLQREEIQMGLRDFGHLAVVVTGLKNLSLKSRTLKSYVKGCLMLPGDTDLTQKSSGQKTKSSSQWSHQLVFRDVSKAKLQESTLELDVWEHASFGLADRPLWRATLPAGPAWKSIVQTPNVWHNFSLPVQTNISTKRV